MNRLLRAACVSSGLLAAAAAMPGRPEPTRTQTTPTPAPGAAARPQPTQGKFDPRRPPARELETRIGEGFTLAAVGDLITSRPLSPLLAHDSGFAAIVDVLRGADAAFGNFENTAIDMRTFDGYPYAGRGDWALVAAPEVPADLRDLGFDLVSRANNHALDWGVEGMRETSRRLDDAGLVHAGVGENREQARAARYLETPLGRVGLVSIASTFRDYSDALPPHGAAPGRPGVNALHVSRTVLVAPETMRSLLALRDTLEAPAAACELSERAAARRRVRPAAAAELTLLDTRFRIGAPPGDRWEMRASDRDEILRAVRQGKQHSDLLVVSIHAHETGPGCETPGAFLPELAKAAIDAGAGVFIAHGEHRLMPIEIYKGRPIFYGLANFFWSDVQEPLPADLYEDNREAVASAFPDPSRVTDADLSAVLNAEGFDDPRVFETIAAVMRWSGGRVAEIRLYPVDLGYGEPLTRSGIPRLAGAEKSREILSRLQRISKPFGTEIAVEDGIGIIRPR